MCTTKDKDTVESSNKHNTHILNKRHDDNRSSSSLVSSDQQAEELQAGGRRWGSLSIEAVVSGN